MKTNQEKHNIFSDPVEILSGTMLCNKYSVIKRMDAKSNNVELFLCEFENKKYVAKIFRNGVAIKEEVSKLKMVNSPYLIKICDVDKFGDSLIVVFPYYKNGSLKGHTFSFEELKQRIIPSINNGLHALHENNVIYKHLKPSNILLCDNEKDIILTNYGIAGSEQTNDDNDYLAAETTRDLYLEESDYYSFGITLYELFCGRTPYGSNDKDKKERSITFQTNIPTRLRDLITGLTAYDIDYRRDKNNPSRRWSYEEVISWCNEKESFVSEMQTSSEDEIIPEYAFCRKKYTSITNLVCALAMNWENGKKQLFRGLMSSFFKSFNPEIAGYCMDAEEAEKKGKDKDLVFFQTLYMISPQTISFYWKGKSFENLNELGNTILQDLRNNNKTNYDFYDDIITNNAILEYMKIQKESNNTLLEWTRAISNLFEKNNLSEKTKVIGYYIIGYVLSGDRALVINDSSFYSIDQLVQVLHRQLIESCSEFEKMCHQLMDRNGVLSEQFEAWLLVLGKKEEIGKWRKIENAKK